ncbi:DUF1294 domain-containing protein [Tuwongella immobilis]|uniref:DUF1294 domain-containing protein n=1 Tax=Tuwongella immobilis TaxID=692036 RepID=A0A6C2YTW5_9BACT|nr:DUF1294 domain-containing protein [Tuwongella immobilis]VIP04926.1 Uncharacterized protein OS=Beggiatoa sp. PS GN=BGP_3585 PE=4 SV=1: DUF1294 [Tuwongella immobilis]VTS07211.1 Uncharacterized protein OS=Beggiatoa sp. PS GN=BGP_3585 PE=4 SV=1: DUF1294 [Tuwongella immobilis]
MTERMPRKYRLFTNYLLGAGVVTLLMTGSLAYGIFRSLNVFTWLASYLAAVNVTTFGFYGFDKYRARIGGRRIPEFVLHTLTAVGGSIGAFLAMRYFRHKTIKGQFQILFWALTAFQVVLILYVAKVLLF